MSKEEQHDELMHFSDLDRWLKIAVICSYIFGAWLALLLIAVVVLVVNGTV